MTFLLTTLMTASSIMLVVTANNSNNLLCTVLSLWILQALKASFLTFRGEYGKDSSALLWIIP